MEALKVEKLRKCFGNSEVLKNIDFTLENEKVLTIIGSSGSGKTTLLRCLNFLEVPDGGQIYVNGKIVLDADLNKKLSDQEIRERRLNFGLVFQNFNLFPQYDALKNVYLAAELMEKDKLKLKASRKDISEAIEKIRDNAMELLKAVGLGDKSDLYPWQLSGGQQQRVAIARALALNPRILCFDEPTSALDPELTGEVLKVIKSLAERHMTMIIVTHEMAFAKDVSDEIIFMNDGYIEAKGSPDEIFSGNQGERLSQFLGAVTNKDVI